MSKKRITLLDTKFTAVDKMSDGNLGAIKVLVELFTKIHDTH
jgi:hypothetical protein